MGKYDKMKAKVIGTTEDGEDFEVIAEFEISRPKTDDYYGNGCYMVVRMPHRAKILVDIRYSGNPDVEIQADRWIESWFGKNAKKVIKEFII